MPGRTASADVPLGMWGYYLAVRMWLHLVWIYVNNYLWRDKMWRRKNSLYREVLIIGDEMALGFGDWVVCSKTPGYARQLHREILGGGSKGVREVRFQWHVASAGHYGSTSDDWLPTQRAKPEFLSFLVRDSLFEDTFGRLGRFADCDCVVVHLGANDGHKDPERTATNLVAIGEELVRRGKRVFLSGMPVRGHTHNMQRGWLLSERNQAIRAAAGRVGSPQLLFGVDLEQYRSPQLFCWDGVHLSSRGYARLGRDTYAAIRYPLINVEFRALTHAGDAADAADPDAAADALADAAGRGEAREESGTH